MDWDNPNHAEILRDRLLRLKWLREKPEMFASLKVYYRDHIDQFIEDWGTTSDPRNVEVGREPFMPFLLWPKQREWINWAIARWRGREDGIVAKSRDSGATWLAVALSCSLCMLYDGVVIGFGSRKQEYVDEKGAPKSIFQKIREYMRAMPPEFRGRDWDEGKHVPYMRAFFPGTGSAITGECGDSIGRGDRTSMYFVDEAAHLEHPALADQALSQTTNCRIDISTPFGMANSFATRFHGGHIKSFLFSWRDDPRKNEAWYAKQVDRLDPVSLAQEVDGSFTASVEDLVIQPRWVQAAIDAHVKLAIEPTGVRRGALDVGDEKDLNAFSARHGIVLIECRAWSGKGKDLLDTAERAFIICDELKLDGFDYDADGMGASVRGDARMISERRGKLPKYRIEAFRGSGAVLDPERKAPRTDVLAKDRYQNAKAQAWSALAERFRNTHHAVNGQDYDADNLISLSSGISELANLCLELSQPQWKLSGTGKLLVDKVPEGALSPNMADSVMIVFAPRRAAIKISDEYLRQSRRLYGGDQDAT